VSASGQASWFSARQHGFDSRHGYRSANESFGREKDDDLRDQRQSGGQARRPFLRRPTGRAYGLASPELSHGRSGLSAGSHSRGRLRPGGRVSTDNVDHAAYRRTPEKPTQPAPQRRHRGGAVAFDRKHRRGRIGHWRDQLPVKQPLRLGGSTPSVRIGERESRAAGLRLWCSGLHFGLSLRRSRVRTPSGALLVDNQIADLFCLCSSVVRAAESGDIVFA
jgi:hypothetical protein